MCGIVGFNWADEGLVRRMADSMRHRGPDDEGVFVDDCVSLGHRRLSIIDLSDQGRQPIDYTHRGRRVVVTFNGEIYNYRQVRAELESEGYRFASRTDSEVIPAAYIAWGEEFISRLNGMWAFALYEPAKGRLLLSRDRFGEKPVYYWLNDGRFIFASEIKAILEYPVPRRAAGQVVADYLYRGVANNGPASFFEGIHLVPPAHNARFDMHSGRLSLRKYYEPARGDHRVEPEEFFDQLKRSVESRLVADVPISISLSGGTDSPSVAALAAESLNTRFKAFTTTSVDGVGDETEVISHFLQRFPDIELERSNLAEDRFRHHYRDILYHMDEPFARQSAYVRWEIANIAHRHRRKVLLNGEGADEVLGGYLPFAPRFYRYLAERRRFGRLFSEIAALLFHPERKRIWNSFQEQYGDEKAIRDSELQRYQSLQRKFGIQLQPVVEPRKTAKDIKDYLYQLVSESSLPRLLNCNDKMTMANSVEARAPFLDHELVDFCFSMDPGRFVVGGRRKYPLRAAMRGKVPNEILFRKQKSAFFAPIFDFLRNPEITARIDLLFREPRTASVFEPAAYRDEFKRFQERRGANRLFLFHGFLLEEWARVFQVEFG